MTTTEVHYNSNITYTCEAPYRMDNGYIERTIRCTENAEWTDVIFSCGRTYTDARSSIKASALYRHRNRFIYLT